MPFFVNFKFQVQQEIINRKVSCLTEEAYFLKEQK